jgi:MFS family permease
MEKNIEPAYSETPKLDSAGTPLEHRETVVQETVPIVYENEEEEPEFHARTWMALLAMWLLNYVQVIALFGPSSVVRPISHQPSLSTRTDRFRTQLSYIGRSLNGVPEQTWVPNALSLVAAVLGPLFSSASDVFQARKPILLGACIAGFVGSGIAPGSQSMGRLIAASVIIGIGYSSAPLGYSVPSEILPRKWRPRKLTNCIL